MNKISISNLFRRVDWRNPKAGVANLWRMANLWRLTYSVKNIGAWNRKGGHLCPRVTVQIGDLRKLEVIIQ